MSMLPMAVPAIGRILEPNINWMGLRYFFLLLSAIGVGTGLGMVVFQGREMLDTEFRGGTQVEFQLRAATPDEIATGIGVNDDDPPRLTLTRADVELRVHKIAEGLPENDPLRPLRNAQVIPINPEADGVTSDRFQVKTYATNSEAVIGAIVSVFSDEVESQPALSFVARDADPSDGVSLPVYPILNQKLGDVIQRPGYLLDVGDFFGGAAILLDDIHVDGPGGETKRPTKQSLEERIAQMRGKPDYSATLDRKARLVVLEGTDNAVESAVLLVWDGGVSYIQNETVWTEELADLEWNLVVEALGSTTTLASVQNFSSVIAKDFENTAVVAVFLSLLLILIYIWVRFGSVRYSLAAIVTLIHDVLTAIGLIALAEILYDNDITASIARSILIEPFKIDLNLVAAILTIIGYSLNDTIVIMDRIRENRGRLPYATRKIVNNSINQTISRTIITSGTTLFATGVLYTFGGPGVRAFSYALLCGVIIGTYSSIAVASPFVWSRKKDITSTESTKPRMP
ncbi:MAG TPA: hypothetical protein ENK11_07175 [Phycisphaerales bacterium]|nr:hypothetical protein [Phycisphaerales bacterium]